MLGADGFTRNARLEDLPSLYSLKRPKFEFPWGMTLMTGSRCLSSYRVRTEIARAAHKPR